MSDEMIEIEGQLNRLEAKALLHGRTQEIKKEIAQLTAKLEEFDQAAAEDWLMRRDQELGRAFKPLV